MDPSHFLPTDSPFQQISLSLQALREGHLTCRQCQGSLALSLARLHRTQRFTVSCSCGMQYEIVVGSRRYSRRATHLPGLYKDSADADKTGEIIVEDLSFGGIKFRTTAPHTILSRDRLDLAFTLNNRAQTRIEDQVRVRYVNGAVVRSTFIDENAFNLALAAYLLQ